MPVLAHRIRLEPNNAQRAWLKRCAGAARFAYNWGLARWNELRVTGAKPTWKKLNAELNVRKKTDLAWLAEIPWRVANAALEDLGGAFARFFVKPKGGRRAGRPRFKSRKRATPGFCIEGRALKFDRLCVHLPKLGRLRAREAPRFPGKILAARFSERAGHWYVSLQIEVDESRWSYPHRCETQAAVGVDLGLRDLAVLSIGERVVAPRVLRANERKLRQLNKELSRRVNGRRNWQKTKVKLARLHERIANIRRDVIHRLTVDLVRRFRWIGIEDLNVAGMARGRLAKSVLDAAPAEVRRQLGYKAPLAGGTIVLADRWFPSSKLCSACGLLYAQLKLGERRWTCAACNVEHDRDVNAAINLRRLAAAHAVTACRHGSTDVGPIDVELSLGQESGSPAVS